MSDKYAALRAAAQEEIMCRESGDTSDAWQDEASPETILELLAERDADRARMAELSVSHNRLRDTMDGGYTPLAAILNASKRAHEESCAAAGISLKIEGE